MRTVCYLCNAQAALRRHRNVADRLRGAITEYAADPTAHANNVAQLIGSAAKRLRVGDYRIIFDETEAEVVVTHIAPRGSAND